MNKAGKIFILILGIMLMIGSCVPIGTTIYRSLNANPAYSRDIVLNQEYISEPFTVDTSEKVMLAILIDINTESLQEKTEFEKTTYQPRYRFPVTYAVTSPAGDKLAVQTTHVDWKGGSKSITNEVITSRDASLTVEAYFQKIKVPKPGRIIVQARVDEDKHYQARAESVTLKVYDLVYDHTMPIVVGIAMFLLGLLAVIGGFIFIVAMPADSNSRIGHLEASRREREIAMWCHLSALAGYLFPFGSIIAPLVLWLTQRNEHDYIDQQGKEAVNFNISVLIYGLISLILVLVFIGIFMLLVLMVFHLILLIVAGVKASQGVNYHYPMILRFVR